MNRYQYRRIAINFGFLVVACYVIYNGLAWAAQCHEDSVAREQKAMRMAKESRSLEMWFSKDHGYHWSTYDDNESFVRGSVSNNMGVYTRIVGWKSRRVGDETYLVSCTYEQEGRERGYYFEVNLNVGTVREIFADTALAGQYQIYLIDPAWKIVETPDPDYPSIRRLDVRVAD